MQTAAKASPLPKLVAVAPPDCARIAEFPYCEVNWAKASPVINQLVTAHPMNAANPGRLTNIRSSSARRNRGALRARR